jgi:glycosyltransferase involved in cell wall biosynthesis
VSTVIHVISHLSPYGGTTGKYYGWLKHSRFRHVFVLHEANMQAEEVMHSFLCAGAQVVPIGSGGIISQSLEIKRLSTRYDKVVFMGHYFRGAVLASIVSLLRRESLIIPLHGSANLFPLSKRILYKMMLRLADKVIYNSQFTARSFHHLGNNQIIYNGYFFDPVPKKPTFAPKDSVRLLAIGGLIKVKQYDLIIRMMKFLPMRFSLTIVGDGPERGPLEKLVEGDGLSERVRFYGYVKDAYRELKNHDIFLHPAVDESFGIVVAEALFSCTPAIVTDRCATYEVVNGEKYGWIADSADPESWAKAVLNIVNNPEQAWAKAEEGRQWAIQMFSADKFSKAMDAVVEEVFVKPGAR